MTDDQTQDARRKRLQDLADDRHRSRHGDYDDMYSDFAADYGLAWNDEDGADPKLPIPRYASLSGDETYGKIDVFDSLTDAVQDQASIPSNGDTLNVPAGVIDLETGEPVEYVLVALTKATADALGGIVAMSEGEDVMLGGEATNKEGIFCDWDELRAAFPIENFRQWVEQNDPGETGQGYDSEAGF